MCHPYITIYNNPNVRIDESCFLILFLATTNRVQLSETIEFNLLNHSYGMLRRRSRHCYCCYSFYTSISYYRVWFIRFKQTKKNSRIRVSSIIETSPFLLCISVCVCVWSFFFNNNWNWKNNIQIWMANDDGFIHIWCSQIVIHLNLYMCFIQKR